MLLFSQFSLIVAGEISVHSKFAEGSIFAFFIPVKLSTLPAHHEAISRTRQIHHSLHNQISASSDVALDVPTYEAGTTAPTLSRSRRASRSQAETETVHVLLVEDNEISQKLLKKQLIRAGCSVVTANDGVEAVNFLLENTSVDHVMNGTQITGVKSARVELVLMGECHGWAVYLPLIQLDIEMPRKGGIEATQDIRSMEASGRLSSRIPIIAVSANARSGQVESVRHSKSAMPWISTNFAPSSVLIQQMLNAGMNAFVSKPFQMAELLSKVEALTGKRPGRGQRNNQ